MKKKLQFIVAMILFITLTILLSVFLLSFDEIVYLIFIPIIWMFYLAFAWGFWREIDEDDITPPSVEGLAYFIPTKYRIMMVKYLFAPGYFIILSIISVFPKKK